MAYLSKYNAIEGERKFANLDIDERERVVEALISLTREIERLVRDTTVPITSPEWRHHRRHASNVATYIAGGKMRVAR